MGGFANFKTAKNNAKVPNVFDSAKSNKKELTKSEKLTQGIEIWTGFYRCNLHRFIKDYFDIKLKLFQKIIIFLMGHTVNFIYLAARRQGKTFLLGLFSSAMAILYPGIKIIVAGGTRTQGIQVINKIIEFRSESSNLHREISYASNSEGNPIVIFHNGSTIKSVASTDSSRGNMAHIIIYDEYCKIKKKIVDAVLKKFRGSERRPKFYDKPEYDNHPSERNRQIFLSSAYYKFNWMWPHFKGYMGAMLNDSKKYFCCGLPYQLSVKEGLLSREQVLEDMSEDDFDPIIWSMEMDTLFYGEGENAFFNYDIIENNRKIKVPIYPKTYYSLLSDNKLKYEEKKEVDGEIRFIAADIAAMQGNINDNSAYIIFQLVKQNNQYLRNIIYMESMNGGHTVDQAIRIRQLYDDFDCDYIVMDTQNIGLGIYDNLVQDLRDDDRDIVYEALTCMNDEKMAERCKSIDAEPLIYSMKGSERINSECAVLLRDAFRRGKIKLLINEIDGRRWTNSLKSFANLSEDEQLLFELPFIQTSLMITEMVNLSSETNSAGGIKVKEPSGMRKDRYSALSYGNYFANMLETNLRVENDDYAFHCFN